MFGRSPAPSKPIPNSFWIEPGRILAGEYPGAPSREATEERLQAFLAGGVSAFLNLTQPGELPPYDVALPPSHPDGRRIIHLNKPLEDHGLPQSTAQMEDILFELDRLLDHGDLVYVHCRAGIGRTNLVLGCWLRRHGMTGPAAIKRLNKLWKDNARSATWPRIPEAHQEYYVLNWAAPGEKAPARKASPAPRKLDASARYMGAVLGLACGDAMGVPVQGLQPGGFAAVTDLKNGAWTDDTSMMLCVAESLLACQGFNADDQMARYVAWLQDGTPSSMGVAAGVPPAVAKAIAAFKWSGNSFAGSHDPNRWDPESLTRLGAVVLYAAHSPFVVFGWAADSSRVTHQSPGVLDACRYYAALLLAVVSGSSKAALLSDAAGLLQQHYGKHLKAPVQRLVEQREYPVGEPPPKTEAVVAVLRRVLTVFGETSNFRDGLLRIGNLGGPSDVQCALFGQLAGAFYGVDAIPERWRQILLQPELLKSAAERLLEAASRRKE